MPLLPGKGNMGRNISELHKGPQFKRTAEEHGKGTADKQAVAIAEKQGDKGNEGAGGSHSEAKAAIAKAHPEHLHKLMKDAHAGKFGAEAQKHAQAAMGGQQAQGAPMEPGAEQAPAAAPQQAPQSFSSIFGDGDGDEGQQAPPPPSGAGEMFGGRRR